MSGEQFSLVWNSFPRNLSSGLYTLLTDEQLVDVTLAAEGQILRAHKLILSVCSPYFRELFKGNSCKHPIVILKDVNYRDLSAMLHFMYQGEVNIKQEDIASFLKVAESLQIKGLTTGTEEKFEENLTKNAENLDQILNIENSSINFVNSNANALISKEEKPVQKNQQCQKQHVLSKDELHNDELSLENKNVNDKCYQQYSISNSTYNIQNSHMEQNNSSTNLEDEPLDCTADVTHIESTKHEPLDYTLDIDTETGYKTCLPNESLYKSDENFETKDYVPDMQLVPYNQNAQTQPFSLSNVSGFENEFTYETGCHNKGRRTVKGISNNSLPLETTLRVVSELGPTLRMERGKVIRMYSCPWCLRHFTRKENLKLHVRYIHGPLESLTCRLCGNKYKNSNSLRVHSYLYHNAKRDKPNKPLLDGGE
ncbi:zinc finger and BTB domain-containing protein 44 isoform X1 [Apis mellifera caucasica]|uniref:Zinc finger and BTB domain-containing protein 44 isoform X1 n=2 Tax=Apis mellifera TaxID=7460 RepID=A0A7M7MKZ2_APIME|nr:zinc finger and BTB domain-containing protein 44 isoform X1 [Apis mellifera]XP_026297534.1 zinc finger and BTB domain-containing protein 44 isoform X1 [Apis mellifera]KAG6800519.1 zinc finger and BTB domain-containing protein 44 isoform X1 [Apis mellifera caucasica]KAG9434495.1 zinc finger and BTB domain-containing protein 44 isoform X1 [Apis mellifera carnica]|eukprot:XP_016768765.1 zinc finger and BTB domain-containing protein 44 isoform X1 [Apis mellifera]